MTDAPVVQMHSVHVQDGRGAIRGMSIALPSGPVGVLVGAPEDGTTALAGALAGVMHPSVGSVLVAGQAPYRSPAIRSRIGALLHEPVLPDVGTVKNLLTTARRLRGGEAPRDPWHGLLSMSKIEDAPVAGLDDQGRRTVALALALAVPDPVLLVLVEPLARVHVTSSRELRALLRERSRAGACVLVLTASSQDASALGDDVGMLQGGAITRAIGAPDPEALTPGSPVEMQVWCDLPRALVSGLVLEPRVLGVSWTGDGAPIRVQAIEVEACAAAIAATAASSGVQVKAMRVVVPSTAEVNAATAGLAVAARYHAAVRSGQPSGAGGGPS